MTHHFSVINLQMAQFSSIEMGVFNVQRCKILKGGGKGEPRFPLFMQIAKKYHMSHRYRCISNWRHRIAYK
jgi:hypothetical protein